MKEVKVAQKQGLDLIVCYFVGYMTDRLYPEMGEAAIKVLEAAGCCGFSGSTLLEHSEVASRL